MKDIRDLAQLVIVVRIYLADQPIRQIKGNGQTVPVVVTDAGKGVACNLA